MKASELECGKVKFFDNRDNKQFGFLRLESAEEIFFHLNDGQKVTVGVGEPCLEYGKIFRIPQVGDVILFKRGQGRQGAKACPWVFGDEFDRVVPESEKNTGKPTLTTTDEGMEYGYYEDGRPLYYKLSKSRRTALGVPAPSFEAPGYSHCGITSGVDLERMLQYPIPEEMKHELRTRFEAYERAIEERRPHLRELLRSILGDVSVRFEDYEGDLAALLEEDHKVHTEQGGWTPEELKKHFKSVYRQEVLERYWKPRTPKNLLHFYPGGCSSAGFLGWDEKLEDVIREDAETLQRLGYTYENVTKRLCEISSLEDQFKVESQCYLGGQNCPFKDCEYANKIAPDGIVDETITNLRTGETIQLPGMIVHLVEVHRFFEGKGSLYRVDPEQLVKVIFG